MNALTFHRVCVEYDGTHVLEDVDLDIAVGEFVAILGPNGSGKTTLLRAALGLQPIAHGKVSLFETPLAKFHDWSRIAVVPQRLPNVNAIPVSVWETVLSQAISSRHRWRPFSRAEKARARTALEVTGLWGRRHNRIDELSGGQQRRALIARALAAQADLYIFDEPTAGLDSENVSTLTDVLHDLSSRGATVIVITHELDEIQHLITRAIVLGKSDRGSIVYDGPTPPEEALHDHVHHHASDVAPPTILEA